jgi:hypothetical protein
MERKWVKPELISVSGKKGHTEYPVNASVTPEASFTPPLGPEATYGPLPIRPEASFAPGLKPEASYGPALH